MPDRADRRCFFGGRHVIRRGKATRKCRRLCCRLSSMNAEAQRRCIRPPAAARPLSELRWCP